MAKEQKTSKTAQKAQGTKGQKQAALIVVIIIGVLLLAGAVAQMSYQARVSKLKTANQQVWNDAVKPLGAVAEYSNVYGGQFWNVCVDNGPCPRASEGWFVPMGSGNDEKNIQDKILDALKKDGYTAGTANNTFGATKDGISVDFMFSPVGSAQPPYAAPDGQTWVQLGATATETSR